MGTVSETFISILIKYANKLYTGRIIKKNLKEIFHEEFSRASDVIMVLCNKNAEFRNQIFRLEAGHTIDVSKLVKLAKSCFVNDGMDISQSKLYEDLKSFALALVNSFERISPKTGDIPNAFSEFLRSIVYLSMLNILDKKLDEKETEIKERDFIIKSLLPLLEQTQSKLAQSSGENNLNLEINERLSIGDIEGAEKLLEKQLKIQLEKIGQYNEDTAISAFHLGNIKLLQLDYQSAEKYFKKAIDYSPNFAEAHNNLGFAIMNITTRTGLTKDGDGFSLFEYGRTKEAVEKFQMATKIKNRFAEPYLNMGKALRRLFKYDEAIEKLQIAIDLKPDLALAYYEMGKTLFKIDKAEEASDMYNKAKRLGFTKFFED